MKVRKWDAIVLAGLLLEACSGNGGGLTKAQVSEVIQRCTQLKVQDVSAVFVEGKNATANFTLTIQSNQSDNGKAAFKLDSEGSWNLTGFQTANNYGFSAGGIDGVCRRKLPLKVN